MARWSADEISDLHLGWNEFHARHPERSFDSYETKARRVRKPEDAQRAAVYRPYLVPEPMGDLAIDTGARHFRIGVVSDTHLGSKFEQLTALRHFYRYADEREVEFFVHAGDLTQGSSRMHPGMEGEVHAHGAEAQAKYTALVYPRSERKTYVLEGNHDESFAKDGGASVGRRVCEERDDLVYLGQGAAFLTVNGLRMFVSHPDGGGGVTKSRRGQVIADSCPPDVNLVLVGHLHYFCFFPQRGKIVIQVPCFQAQYSWMARKPLFPDIGGVILDVWLTDDNRIARVVPEFVSYEPKQADWDPVSSHEVNRPWTADGLVVEEVV